MNKLSQNKFLIIIALFAFVLSSCDNDDSLDPADSEFNRIEFLQEVSQNYITPHLNRVASSTAELSKALESDITAQSISNLRDSWIAAYEHWQYIQFLNFGPAETLFGTLQENVATFPVDVTLLEEYAAQGDTTLNNFDRDTRGFLGIEYILFNGSSEDIAEELNEDPNRLAYLKVIVADVVKRIEDVRDEWIAEESEFTSDDATSAGSSTSNLFNAFSAGFEQLKNFKVALPAGLRAGQIESVPTNVEAYYSGESVRFIKTHYKSVVQQWMGVGFDGTENNDLGWKKYLSSVEGGPQLIIDTEAQIAAVGVELDKIDESENFANMIRQDDPRVLSLHTELQKNTRFFKSDMSSLLGISITFNSGDGD